LAILALITGVVLGLVFVPKDFNLEAEGTLVADARRQIFAAIDGEVIDVLVDHRSRVTVGQELVRLRNRDIEIQLADLQGQLQTTLKERASILGRLSQYRELEPAEFRALQTQELELVTKLE